VFVCWGLGGGGGGCGGGGGGGWERERDSARAHARRYQETNSCRCCATRACPCHCMPQSNQVGREVGERGRGPTRIAQPVVEEKKGPSEKRRTKGGSKARLAVSNTLATH